MKPPASLFLLSAVTAAALCGGCAVYPSNAPAGYGSYGYDDGGYDAYGGYPPYGYGYAPAQPPNVYLGFGGYSGYREPYYGRGYRGDWNGGGRHWNGGGGRPPPNNQPPPPHAGGGGGPPPGGGGGHAPPPQGPRGGGRAPAAPAVDVSPNNGSRATNH
jgi:hypothetical protein